MPQTCSPLLVELLERAINRALSLTPEYPQKFSSLAGRVVAIQPDGLDRCLYICPGNNGIQLAEDMALAPQATVHGSPLALLACLLPEASLFSEVFRRQIRIDGDALLVDELLRIFRSLNVDWQERLSRLMGQAAAGQLSGWLQDGRHWQQELVQNFQQDLHEYLQHEVGVLVPETDADSFLERVDQLRNRVEVLVARIDRLEAAGESAAQ